MIEYNQNKINRLSLRMSVFAWAVCAILGWVFAISIVNTVVDENSSTMIAHNEPSSEDALRMQQILPAAGGGH